MWMSELVKEGGLRSPGASLVGSSPTSHIVLLRSRRAGSTLCIGVSGGLVCLKDGHCMGLRLEEHPLEGPGHLDPTFCRRDLCLLLKPFTAIFLGLNDDGLHLKM